MKRGAVWTAASAGTYTGKPGPVVIIQDDRFDATDSVTVVPLTTQPVDAPIFRLPVEATPANGLQRTSFLMIDKITTVSRDKLGKRLGTLRPSDMQSINRAVTVFLGLASA